MPSDEGDSGIDALSMPESREASPSSRDQKESMIGTQGPDDLDDEIDETYVERLVGLTEMFPDSLRNGVCSVATGSMCATKWLYKFSRSAFWVFFSSSALLVAPIIFEMERQQMKEMEEQQQRQFLLGPSAAMSGGLSPSVGYSGLPTPPRF